MAAKAKVLGITLADKAPRGNKMKTGKGWRLTSPNGKSFKASLVTRKKIGAESVAIFRVLPTPE